VHHCVDVNSEVAWIAFAVALEVAWKFAEGRGRGRLAGWLAGWLAGCRPPLPHRILPEAEK